MPEKSFTLEILGPEKKIYAGKVSALVAPAQLGYVGILANHAPFMAMLKPGTVNFKEESGKRTDFSSTTKGFLEVFKNNVTILLDSAEGISV